MYVSNVNSVLELGYITSYVFYDAINYIVIMILIMMLVIIFEIKKKTN